MRTGKPCRRCALGAALLALLLGAAVPALAKHSIDAALADSARQAMVAGGLTNVTATSHWGAITLRGPNNELTRGQALVAAQKMSQRGNAASVNYKVDPAIHPVSTDMTIDAGPRSVTLSGFAADKKFSQQLSQAVATVYGEGQIVNDIKVRPKPVAPNTAEAVVFLAALSKNLGSVESATLRIIDGIVYIGDNEPFSADAANRLNESLTGNKKPPMKVVGTYRSQPSSDISLEQQISALFGRKGIDFATGTSEIDKKSLQILDMAAALLQQNPKATCAITGISGGSNASVAKRRAQAVQDYLVAKGVAKQQLSTSVSSGSALDRAERKLIDVSVQRSK